MQVSMESAKCLILFLNGWKALLFDLEVVIFILSLPRKFYYDSPVYLALGLL